MRSLAFTAAAALLLIGAAPPADPVPADAGAFAWLAGSWYTEEEIGWTEERWARPRGGVMLGTSLGGRGDRARDWEFMRIAADRAGKVGFYASVRGRPPVRFDLVSASGERTVFENPANDYPSRIEYRRSGDILTATISGLNGRNPQTWRYRRTGE